MILRTPFFGDDAGEPARYLTGTELRPYREWHTSVEHVEAARFMSRRALEEARLSTWTNVVRADLEVQLQTSLLVLLNRPRLDVLASTADSARHDVYAWLRSRAVKAWHRLADRLERRWPVRMKTYEARACFAPGDLPNQAGVVSFREVT